MGLGRARQYNNKGLVSEHRNPKASYFVAKHLYESFKKRSKVILKKKSQRAEKRNSFLPFLCLPVNLAT